MAREQSIAMERMHQQSGLLGAEDDWTGVTSSAVRRRVQNRINQRTHRIRKRLEAKQWRSGGSQSLPQAPERSNSVSNEQPSISAGSETATVERGSIGIELWRPYSSAPNRSLVDRQILSRQSLSRVAVICKLGPLDQQKLISEFKRWVERCQRLGSPRTDHLLVLVKLNVLRGLLSNGADLGYAAGDGAYRNEALSPFTNPSNPMWHVRSAPAALQPTQLQRQIPHHPWIDLIPSPVMRDTLLLAGDTYDVLALCADLVGFFGAEKGTTGVIIWGEPWDIAGWEVTQSFAKRWGWIIEGCEQILRATNYWRERRGEEPLQVGRILYEED